MKDDAIVPSPSIRECLSWKLIAEFMRRHPDFGTVIEAHPGGGQYDCLAVCRNEQLALVVNRCGSITNLENGANSKIDAERVWLGSLAEGGIGNTLDEMSRLAGMPIPSPLPSTSREALIYRIIVVIISAQIFDKRHWCCKNGQEDTAGYGNQEVRDQWFLRFPEAEADRTNRLENDFLGNPNYRYWFVCCDEIPVACLSKQGFLYTPKGDSVDLMDAYRNGSTVENLASRI